MQDEVKVSQADREAAANWFFEPTEAEVCEPFCRAIREGRDDGNTLVQAFAKFEQSIRHQAERETLARMEWRDIESAPRDGSWFTAYWPVQTFEDRVQTTRWLHDDCRFVDASDFMDHIQPIAWMPLPPAPEAA